MKPQFESNQGAAIYPVKLLIIGAGSRGTTYGTYALEHPDQARVVGLAEPREIYRSRLAQAHAILAQNCVADWQQLAARPRLADAVIIATPDLLHLEPALAFIQQGYNVLLEKPLAPDPDSCRQIIEAARTAQSIFAVCHVLRYTAYTQKLKQLLDSGQIGELVSVQHLEPVGYWHYAHSYVRGNWHREATSSFMLLAKSCHDLDWLRYMVGSPCDKVSSFGSLLHFRPAAKPREAGRATRCLDCAYEPDCPYSSKRFYFDLLNQGETGWPLDVVTTDFSSQGLTRALQEGPYGRCVYELDNDVVDHQIVNLLYQNGVTASFTMVGPSRRRDRETIFFGSRGELRGDGEKISHYDFLTGRTTEYNIETPATAMKGHGSGDYNLMQRFVAAVAHRDASQILSGPVESLETHLTVFAADQARREGKVIQLAS